MDNKYKIVITKLEPYKEKDVQYEGEDGKVYTSEYNVPKEVKYKKVGFETGKTKYDERDWYEQEVESLDLIEVLKAVNKIK